MRYFIVYLTRNLITGSIHINNKEINYYKEINSKQDIEKIEKEIGNYCIKVTIINYIKLQDE